MLLLFAIDNAIYFAIKFYVIDIKVKKVLCIIHVKVTWG